MLICLYYRSSASSCTNSRRPKSTFNTTTTTTTNNNSNNNNHNDSNNNETWVFRVFGFELAQAAGALRTATLLSCVACSFRCFFVWTQRHNIVVESSAPSCADSRRPRRNNARQSNKHSKREEGNINSTEQLQLKQPFVPRVFGFKLHKQPAP